MLLEELIILPVAPKNAFIMTKITYVAKKGDGLEQEALAVSVGDEDINEQKYTTAVDTD